MSFTVTWAKVIGRQHLEAKIIQAFEAWVEQDVNDHFYDEFHDVKWNYSRETRRKNPNAPLRDAGSPRDIIDYGELYESGKESFELNRSTMGVSANWTWDARGNSGYCYAADVHEGEGTSAGNPRRWTDDLRIPQKFDRSTLKALLNHRIAMAVSIK